MRVDIAAACAVLFVLFSNTGNRNVITSDRLHCSVKFASTTEIIYLCNRTCFQLTINKNVHTNSSRFHCLQISALGLTVFC